MSVEPWFVDTNILVYAFDDDSPQKRAVARRILLEKAEHVVLSAQVLGEFYVSVTRKLARPLDTVRAIRALDALCAFSVRPLGADLLRSAVRRSNATLVSYWDALIIETALDAGATVLLTEDLQHSQEFGRLRVVNPFRDDVRLE